MHRRLGQWTGSTPWRAPAARRLAFSLAMIGTLGPGLSLHAAALTTERVASGLARPIFATAPAGDDRLFIIEQQGRIKILRSGTVLPTPFLDIRALIPNISGNDERGLLGLVFHPNYAANGHFYVNYIDLSGNTVIARYHVSADPDVADPSSAFTILTIPQPYQNHKGGTLLFGPNDGYLYIGMGDGGSSGDPENRAQDPSSLLGKILRIDVDAGSPYAIPAGNPYAGPGLPLDEIWDLGLRNPYRWSFDRATGNMYIADVGQSLWEEVDFEAAHGSGGVNYGWRIMEGNHCYNPPQNCNTTGITLPIYEYSHGGTPPRCSITGGYVYRGNMIPSLRGTYFFADFCSNQIWSFRYDGAILTEFTDRTAELAPGAGLVLSDVAGFGEDSGGEMYIVDRGTGTDGEIYRIDVNPSDVPGGLPTSGSVDRFRPNPFSESTRLSVSLTVPERVAIEVVDASGRAIRSFPSRDFPVGRSEIEWDGRDAEGRPVASGIYFLRARVGSGTLRAQRVQVVR
jgi:glucose/arabinose dehydrogenase